MVHNGPFILRRLWFETALFIFRPDWYTAVRLFASRLVHNSSFICVESGTPQTPLFASRVVHHIRIYLHRDWYTTDAFICIEIGTQQTPLFASRVVREGPFYFCVEVGIQRFFYLRREWYTTDAFICVESGTPQTLLLASRVVHNGCLVCIESGTQRLFSLRWEWYATVVLFASTVVHNRSFICVESGTQWSFYLRREWFATALLFASTVVHNGPFICVESGIQRFFFRLGTGSVCTGSSSLLAVVLYWLTRPVHSSVVFILRTSNKHAILLYGNLPNAFRFLCSLMISATPPAVAPFHVFLPSACFLFCTLKDICHPPAVEIFHAFLPSAFFMFGLFLCVEYLLPATVFRVVFRSVFVFWFVCALLYFVCWWEPTTLCPKSRSDGVTQNIKIWYVATIYNSPTCAREHQQHQERHIIATRCTYFSWLFLVFFCGDDRNHPRPIKVLSPDSDGKWSENASFLGLRRRLQRAPLTSRGGPIGRATLGQYTATVQYTDCFLPQYNPYWLSQPVPSPGPFICVESGTQRSFHMRREWHKFWWIRQTESTFFYSSTDSTLWDRLGFCHFFFFSVIFLLFFWFVCTAAS